MKIKTLFFSDAHLGSKFAKSDRLLEFLKEIKNAPEKIYIIGDFIDGWKVKTNWCWNDNCNLVIRKLLSFLKKGSKIYYISGNHDEFLRAFLQGTDDSFQFGNIMIGDDFVHETADGKKLLIIHGDRFDVSIKYARWVCFLGDIGYDLLIRINGVVNWFRRLFGCKSYWSLSKAVKHRLKQAVNYISDFEKFLTKYCEEKGCTGVVCGHIHTAAIKEIDGYDYYNTGDWVESMTAIVEHNDGSMELIDRSK